ncbi:MAG: TraB/GumN family protein [Flavihumibacter sp.]|nr:TraB/GumN family protein [Flavihumibacter sp.]
MKRILFFILFIVPFFLTAQQKKNAASTLLWRISGKGMQKPSYLYGTMHLQDKRLFYFTDSLYASIRSVEGFAGELDMNDLNDWIIQLVKDEEQKDAHPVLLKDKLTAAQKKKYQRALEKKFRKSLDAITFDEVEDEASDWSRYFRKPDDMPTFVDAYLFGIAGAAGKWTGALEKVEDQLDLEPVEMDSIIRNALVEDKQKQQLLEDFVSIYLSEDLTRMNEIVVKASGDYGNRKMNFRNLNMVHRIDSLAKIRSCFYAVGAAHLPGDSGMIQLLRNKGFEVKPVFSSNRVEPDEFLHQQTTLNWKENTWSNGDFVIKMPGSGANMDDMGAFQKACVYFDPFSMSGYMSGFIPMVFRSEAEIDSAYLRMRKNYEAEGDLFRDSVWLLNGKKAYEIEGKNKHGFMQVLASPVPGGMVLNMIISMSKSGLKMARATSFFHSFVVNKKPQDPKKYGWRRKIIALKQLSYEAPVELEFTETKEDSSWITQTFAGSDEITGNYFLINLMETKPGLFSSLDSLYFLDVIKSYQEDETYQLYDYSFITQDGFPGVSISFGSSEAGDSLRYLFNIINRGNRRYAIMVAYFPGEKNLADAQRFQKGIRFLPYAANRTVAGHPSFENFLIQSPMPFVKETDAAIEEGSSRFIMYDSTSAVTFHVQKEPLNRYYSTKSDSSFLSQFIEFFKATEADSLVQLEIKYQDGYATADGVFDLDGTHNLKRVKIMASGDTLYSVAGVFSSEVSKTAAYQTIFDSFRLQQPSPNSYTQSKAKRLFQDLLLPDSLIFQEAKDALSQVDLSKEELPYLHEALLHPLIDFSDRLPCTHDEVIRRLLEVMDSSTIAFIQQAYPGLKERNAVLQYPLLSVLARFQTADSYRLIESLLSSGLPASGSPDILYSALQDSLELAKTFFPFVLQHSDDSLLRTILPRFTLDMKSINALADNSFKELQPVFISLADQYQLQMQDKQLDMPIHFDELVKLLLLYGSPEALQRIDSFAVHSNEDIQYNTVNVLIEEKKPVPSVALYKLLADPFYRAPLYRKFNETNQLKKFPARYRKPVLIAESQLYREIWYGTEDYKLKFIKQISLKQDGKKQYYYLYKVSFNTEDGEESYLGVAGPFLSKSRIDTTPGEYTGVYYDELLDESKLMEQFEAFIQSLQ